MEIPSGKTDQYVPFVAVDATDMYTRETGLSSFTVYRSRNGGTATAYTSPTVVEMSSANAPGIYWLLIDEDTTIASTSDSEQYVVHITATGMAPVSLSITLKRNVVTSGQTLTVASGEADVNVTKAAGTAWNSGAIGASTLATDTITNAKIAADAIGSSEFAQAAADKVWSTASRVLTAGTNIALAKGVGVTGFNDIAATDVWSSGTRTLTAGTNISLAKGTGVTGFNDIAATDVWSSVTRTLTAGTNIALAKGTGVTGFNDLDATGIRSAIGLATNNLDTQLSTIDTVVDAVKAKTDSLTFTLTGQVDANVQYANDIKIGGDGQPGTEWGPA